MAPSLLAIITMTLIFTLSFRLILAPLPSPSINAVGVDIAPFSAMAHEEDTTLALTHTH